MEAVGVSDASRCVYVGDRLFDDVWGAKNAGMRAVFVPHSAIPAEQVGHTEGGPPTPWSRGFLSSPRWCAAGASS